MFCYSHFICEYGRAVKCVFFAGKEFVPESKMRSIMQDKQLGKGKGSDLVKPSLVGFAWSQHTDTETQPLLARIPELSLSLLIAPLATVYVNISSISHFILSAVKRSHPAPTGLFFWGHKSVLLQSVHTQTKSTVLLSLWWCLCKLFCT